VAAKVDGDFVSPFPFSPVRLDLTCVNRKLTKNVYSHLPDNKGVNYQVFLRALYSFAKVEMRLGR
jgi:hypothetical protein